MSAHWSPQPGPQTRLLSCPVFEVFYGGARGGGKTDGVLGDWIAHQSRYGECASGLVVRRTLVECRDMIERSRQLFGPLGAVYREVDKSWRFPNGARLAFAYLERDADAHNYQGHSYTRIYVDEAGNFPRPDPILFLLATLRSAHGVPVGIRLTGNPGGPGHLWVRHRYIDHAPLGYQVITDARTGLQRVYIPSRVSDNPALTAGDPGYVARLKSVGSEALVRAWLEGDWSIIQGAFFDEWSMARHVIDPFAIPEHWVRFRAGDWGSAKPFAFLWFAVSDGTLPGHPRGQLVAYREWYGMEDRPNVGLKLTVEQAADGILERQARDEKIDYSVLDPACFADHGGPSIASRFASKGVFWQRADNSRVGVRGAMGGWDAVRNRLIGEDEHAMLVFFSTCRDVIRTLPALQHDARRPEDVDSEGEDHAPDAVRYACMSRPWVRGVTVDDKPRWAASTDGLVIADAMELRRRQRSEANW